MMMNTNCNSHIALIQGFLPMLKKSKGKIVNISSIAGIFGSPLRTLYSASKFAIAGFSKALRPEVKLFGIDVIMIYPGYIRTNISLNASVGKANEKFGKTDQNIAQGMSVEEFSM
mmetsp:Transcript_55072/g.75683  ORF Transcript_55072/g.75683 Transcript_55072/m.75683 type:complete len:115 (-) Transcript_55072:150-494(-)